MSKSRCCLLSLLSMAACLAGSLQAEDRDRLRKKIDEAVAKVFPALVQVHVVTPMYREGRELKYQSAGSGVIISKKGHVVTNHHVAGKAKRIRCALSNRKEVEAILVGSDPLADIAVIKMNPGDLGSATEKFPTAKFGNSDKLRVGDRVLALGSPVAVSQSVTLGIVSNTRLIIPKLFWPFKFTIDGEEVGSLVRWIGHDAAIYGGNSGGPLIDLDGKIVGINDIGIGLGGAIPGNLAKTVAEEIIKHGKVRRSTVGWRVQPMLKGSNGNGGALICCVPERSAAYQAGLRAGDILLKFDGKPVSVRIPEDMPDLNRMVLFTPVGKTINVEVLRNGTKMTRKMKTELREPVRGKDQEMKSWGATVRNITASMAEEHRRPNREGAFVWSVRPGGPSGEAKPAMQSEDYIVRVGDQDIADVNHLKKLTAEITQGKTEPVPTVVAFERKGKRMLTVVKLGISKDLKKPREVKKAWLPVAYQVVTPDLAKALKLKNVTGVRITQVYPRSTAEKAGLRKGDIITHLDGERLQVSQPEDAEVFAQSIREYKVGTKAEMAVLRGSKFEKKKIEVELVSTPVPASRMNSHMDKDFEFKARDISYFDRVEKGWSESQKGAVIVSVEPGGWARLAHLAVGDLILKVNGTDLENAKQLKHQMTKVATDRAKHVHFFVKRGVHTLYVEMEPDWGNK